MMIVKRAQYRAIPWKNGRGVAHQIAVHPRDAGYDSFVWQVSRPEITADSPFSSFAGLDRQFMLVSGNGVELSCPEFTRRIDAPLEPFAFRGEWDVQCRLLDGPVQVLNVMTRRGRAGARIEVLALDAMTNLDKPARETLLAFVGAGEVDAYGSWGTEVLRADDSVLVDESERTAIALAPRASGTRIVVVRLDVM